jgi:hypothetical protein
MNYRKLSLRHQARRYGADSARGDDDPRAVAAILRQAGAPAPRKPKRPPSKEQQRAEAARAFVEWRKRPPE